MRTASGEPHRDRLDCRSDDAENAIIVVPGANAADDREVEPSRASRSVTCSCSNWRSRCRSSAEPRVGRRHGACGSSSTSPRAALPADVIAPPTRSSPTSTRPRRSPSPARCRAPCWSPMAPTARVGNGRTWSAHSVPRHQVLDTTGAGDAFWWCPRAALALLVTTRVTPWMPRWPPGAAAVRRVGALPTRSCEPQAVKAPRSGRVHDENDAVARDPVSTIVACSPSPARRCRSQLPAQGGIIDAACALLDRQPGDALGRSQPAVTWRGRGKPRTAYRLVSGGSQRHGS